MDAAIRRDELAFDPRERRRERRGSSGASSPYGTAIQSRLASTASLPTHFVNAPSLPARRSTMPASRGRDRHPARRTHQGARDARSPARIAASVLVCTWSRRLLPGVVRGVIPECRQVAGREADRLEVSRPDRAAATHVMGQRPQPDPRTVQLEGRPVVGPERSVRLVAAVQVVDRGRRSAGGDRRDRPLDPVRRRDDEPGHPVVEPGGQRRAGRRGPAPRR